MGFSKHFIYFHKRQNEKTFIFYQPLKTATHTLYIFTPRMSRKIFKKMKKYKHFFIYMNKRLIYIIFKECFSEK